MLSQVCRQSLKCSDVNKEGPAAIYNQTLGEKAKCTLKLIVGVLTEKCVKLVSGTTVALTLNGCLAKVFFCLSLELCNNPCL